MNVYLAPNQGMIPYAEEEPGALIAILDTGYGAQIFAEWNNPNANEGRDAD